MYVAVDICTSQPCLNGGRCDIISSNVWNCTCLPGYIGSFCETGKPRVIN